MPFAQNIPTLFLSSNIFNKKGIILTSLSLLLGGTIGSVSVTWVISTSRTTAQRDADYVADGATLTFSPGETTKSKCNER